jgi:predicted DNA-binding protein
MPNTSTKSRMVSFRLKNEVREKIENALNSPLNHNTSVSDYCKEVIERYAFRHMKNK